MYLETRYPKGIDALCLNLFMSDLTMTTCCERMYGKGYSSGSWLWSLYRKILLHPSLVVYRNAKHLLLLCFLHRHLDLSTCLKAMWYACPFSISFGCFEALPRYIVAKKTLNVNINLNFFTIHICKEIHECLSHISYHRNSEVNVLNIKVKH